MQEECSVCALQLTMKTQKGESDYVHIDENASMPLCETFTRISKLIFVSELPSLSS